MAKAKFQFGQAFDKLSKIVEQLESGEVDLDQALKQYEDGLKLVQECKKQLSAVENKVKVIREKYAEAPEAEEENDSEEDYE